MEAVRAGQVPHELEGATMRVTPLRRRPRTASASPPRRSSIPDEAVDDDAAEPVLDEESLVVESLPPGPLDVRELQRLSARLDAFSNLAREIIQSESDRLTDRQRRQVAAIRA
jgi:hypothetical protein